MGTLEVRSGNVRLDVFVDDVTITDGPDGVRITATLVDGKGKAGSFTLKSTMTPKKIQNMKRGPERIIQDDLIAFLRLRGWVVRETHGNLYQNGFPDLYCAHSSYGARWIEVKNPASYQFEASQLEFFPQLYSVGVGVWVLVAATEEEYKKLFKPCNWWQYLSCAKGTTRVTRA